MILFSYFKKLPNTQLKATASLMQSFDKVIVFSFSVLVCCSKLICKTKLIEKPKKVVDKTGIVVLGGVLSATSL